jgi:hypothetical protein
MKYFNTISHLIMSVYKILLFSLGLFISREALSQNLPSTGSKPAAVPVVTPSAYSKVPANFIRGWQPSMPTSDTAVVSSSNRTTSEIKQATRYFDDFGKTVQTVAKSISPSGKDLVQPIVNDEFGRERYSYLPYVQLDGNTSDGRFKVDPFNSQKSFYQNQLLNPGVIGEQVYYGSRDFEPSPLNRVLSAYAPGNSWAKNDLKTLERGGDHKVQYRYFTNTADDSVRIWKISNDQPLSTAIYAAETLKKYVGVNESGNQVCLYFNKSEQLVLKKTQLSSTASSAHAGWQCTYYVYDDWGNMRFVIPPMAVEKASQSAWNINAVLDELCFQYQYDGRNRMIMKRLPGAGAVYMVYDKRDRLVFTQDAVQRTRSPQEWQIILYDTLDRPLMAGMYKTGVTQAALQSTLNSSTLATQLLSFPTADGNVAVNATYPLPGLSTGVIKPLIYVFYDNYNYSNVLGYATQDLLKPLAGNNPYVEALPGSASAKTNNLVTGMKVRVIGTDQWLTTTTYFNDKNRAIQSVAENGMGGKDITISLYDFEGKVLSTYLRHTNPHSSITPQTTILTMFGYDDAGRLTSIKKRLNDDADQDKTTVLNSYDELGNLYKKRIGVTGTSSQLDSLVYTYTIRGWLDGINKSYVNTPGSSSNWFGQELNYDYGFSNSLYNGNISGTKWKSRSDGLPRAYGYEYDSVQRLKSAYFTQQNTGSISWTQDQVNFSVSNLNYDANGNITTMTQKGQAGTVPRVIDDLVYTYQPGTNKLIAVSDSSNTKSFALGDFTDGLNSSENDYSYDANGNITTDLNKGISSIVYNDLNLPRVISIPGKGTITYLYDATGTKLKKNGCR